VVLELTL